MKFLLAFLIFFLAKDAFSQSPIVQSDLDINNVRATILTHGDMFWDRQTQTAAYEFPKGSGIHSSFTTSLWTAGYDPNTSNLHTAAQTYRQSGSDYWPGPIDNTSPIDSTTSTKWDKIWKVNLSDITLFKSIQNHTLANTPQSILEWPAKGNPYTKDRFGNALPILKNMAPFFDVNADGNYNALDGDFPLIKGEQALWWIFNDQKLHTETFNTHILNFEYKATAYACNSIPGLQNVTFYSFDITNYDTITFEQTRIGIFTCGDLGYYGDDYIGVDTTRRMGYFYNGDSFDDGPYGYGSNLTKNGIAILHSPQDSIGYKAPLGAFTFFPHIENPETYNHFNNYLRGSWKDGQPFTDACNGRSAGNPINFVFTGDPCLAGSKSEVQCANMPSDRVFVLTTSDFTIHPNETKNFTFAVLNTPRAPHTYCVDDLKALADTVFMYPEACISSILASSSQIESTPIQLKLYPNPVDEKLIIAISNNFQPEVKSLNVINSLGQRFSIKYHFKDSQYLIDVSTLPKGFYVLQLITETERYTSSFLKK